MGSSANNKRYGARFSAEKPRRLRRPFRSSPRAADTGDETAIRVYKKSGAMLGRALAVLVDIINPEMIVIGSVFQRSGHLLRAEMEKTLKKEAISYSLDVCRVVPAELGDVAAVTVAMEMA